jgi:hypothetical protein
MSDEVPGRADPRVEPEDDVRGEDDGRGEDDVRGEDGVRGRISPSVALC